MTEFGSALIVEDNVSAARLLRQCLLAIGYAPVYDATDVNEALAVIKDQDIKPGICLVDYHLGGRDGLHFVRIMRQSHSANDMKIYLVTADDSKDLNERAHKVGVNGIIIKPITAKSLGLALLSDSVVG